MQTNMSLGKKLEKTIANTITESPPQTPPEKQPAEKRFETLTPLQAFWPSGKDESINLGLRVTKSESVFHNQSSVETLYASSSFKTISPEKETSKDHQTTAQSSICREEDVSLQPLTMWGECTPQTSQWSEGNALQRQSVTSLPPSLFLFPLAPCQFQRAHTPLKDFLGSHVSLLLNALQIIQASIWSNILPSTLNNFCVNQIRCSWHELRLPVRLMKGLCAQEVVFF